jgi:hypothetical protein
MSSDSNSGNESNLSDEELEDGEIISHKKKNNKSHKKEQEKDSDDKIRRKELFLNAKEEFEEISCQLPQTFDNITVLEFGEIKSNKNFYTTIKIYPIGYKCEVTIKGSNPPVIIVVEVVDMDDQLEFLVTMKSSNRVHMASSEDDVFRKVMRDTVLLISPACYSVCVCSMEEVMMMKNILFLI